MTQVATRPLVCRAALALSLWVPACGPRPPRPVVLRSGADTSDVHAALRTRIDHFERDWRTAWERAQRRQHRPLAHTLPNSWDLTDPDVRRTHSLACYFTSPERLAFTTRTFVAARAITDGQHGAVCPAWLPRDDDVPFADEASAIDLALMKKDVPGIRAARSALLLVLAGAQQRFPLDSWIVGQRVRFAIDQGERASEAARSCLGDEGWCGRLQGLAYLADGDEASAESAFRTAERIDDIAATSSSDAGCVDEDVQSLLDSDDRDRMRDLPCSEQRRARENMWWLADPLWSVAGNERYVAHHGRVMHVALRSIDDGDERYVWARNGAGRALREMIVRYGWPTYTYWPGVGFDTRMSKALEATPPFRPMLPPPASRTRPAGRGARMTMDESAIVAPPIEVDNKFIRVPFPPYTAKEYSPGRSAFIPPLGHMLDPFAFDAAGWTLRNADDANVDAWWPHEHMKHPVAIDPLPPGQRVLLRRDSVILYRMAVARRPRDASAQGYPLAVLVGATSSDSMRELSRRVLGNEQVLRVGGEFGSTPIVVSAEIFTQAPGPLVLRGRYGIRPPPTLLEMRSGEVALSDLALLRMPDRGPHRLAHIDTVHQYMAGNHFVYAADPVSLYWESYGFSTADTVNIALEVRSEALHNTAERMAALFGFAPAARDSVSVRWTETDPGRSAVVIPGARPAAGRTLALDLRALTPGPYVVSVEMRSRTGATARSTRQIEVLPPR